MDGQAAKVSLRDAGWSLALAGRFLTRWPFPAPTDAPPTLYAHAAPWYPLIGLLLGAVLWASAIAGDLLALTTGPGAPALAALLLGVWVWSTGALHLDGLADCADAWVGGLGDRERTLAIMKDPHIGAMGVTTLVLVLLAKFAALVTLIAAGGLWALLWLPVLARVQILWLVLTTPAARPEGLGGLLGAHLPRRPCWLAAALGGALAIGGIGLMSWAAAAAAAVAAALMLWGWRRTLVLRLGGYTGDGLGALVELSETLVLFAVALAVAADWSAVSLASTAVS